jgi:acetyl esterase/lipase
MVMVTTRDYGVREPLHPEIRALFDATLAAREAQPRVLDAVVQRSTEPILAAMFNAGAPEVAVEREITLPGADGEMKALVHAAAGEGLPVILYAHGGGYCVMSPQTHAKITKQLANRANAAVLSIDYRLAPEHPHPAGIEDCMAAYVWLRHHAGEIGGDPSRIALAGDSAGGGIVVAAAQRLVALSEKPAAVLVNCGWLDLNDDSPSFQAYGPGDPLIDTAVMDYWRACYEPDPARWRDADVSPLFGDVAGFPPACVVAAGIDPLCDDGLRFAAKLRDAGRDVELLHYEGMPHVFSWFPGVSTGPPAVDAMCAFLRSKLHD